MVEEYLFDRDWNELRYKGKLLILRDYGDKGSVTLADYSDVRSFQAHAFFEASDFLELARIFSQLGYRVGRDIGISLPYRDEPDEIKMKVQHGDMLKIRDLLKGKLCFKMDVMHYYIEDSRLEGILCIKECTIRHPKPSMESMLAYLGKGSNLGVSVNNAQMALQLFRHIGCKTYPAYYMQRSAYIAEGVRVFLDTVSRHCLTGSPSQHYAVIEGDMGKAFDAAYNLRIDHLDVMFEPYSELFR